MIKGLKCALVLALVFSSHFGSSQSIFSNPITGTNPSTANPYTAGQTHDPNITVSGIGRGPGINGVNANNAYRADGWSLLSILNPDEGDYFEFTLTPNPCLKINLTSFVFKIQSSALTGPNLINLRSSLDNYSQNILTTSPTLSLGTETTINVNLSASTYQNITTPITFRLYGWGPVLGTLSVNEFTFNGTVTANTTTWSGTAWSNGLPNLSTHAIIAGNYNTSAGGSQTSFRACSLTVNAGSALNIDNNTYIEVENNLVANGNITVQTHGNFKHNSDASTVSGTGTTSVIKQTALKSAWYFYTYWSSPVSG